VAGYREFHVEKIYESPDVSRFLDQANETYAQGVSNLFNTLNTQMLAKQKQANDFKYELKGKRESDQKILTEYAKGVFEQGYNEIKGGKGVSMDTKKKMADGTSWAELSEIQFQEADGLQKEIFARETKDPFYNSRPALTGLKLAYEGENGEKNIFNTDLKSFSKEIDKVTTDPETSTFKNFEYRQHYVKSFKDKTVEKSSKNPNFASSKYNQAVFWDDEKGVPGVTDQHAIDYIKSRPEVDSYFNAAVNDQLDAEVKSMKASNDPRISWMNGLSDEAIKNELIMHPEKNLVNKTDFGARKRQLAKDDLKMADRVNTKVSTEVIAPKDARNPDGTLDTVAHNTTFISDTFTTNPSNLNTAVTGVAGPGGNLMTKKGVNPGKPIVTDLSSTSAFNLNEGKATKRGNGKFNVTGYQLNAYDVSGKLVPIAGNSTLDLVSKINSMKPEDFKNLAPEMKISIKGYALDESKMLGDIEKQKEKLHEEIYEAEQNDDMDKVDRLNERLSKLDDLRNYFNNPNAYNEDIVYQAMSSGIKQIRVDQLIQANPADLDRMNALTGLELKNENKWSEEMKVVQDAYRKKYQEATGSAASGASVKSDGSDLKNWSQDLTYDVGGKIYYFDKAAKAWKKK
jgi:hypothetical protein